MRFLTVLVVALLFGTAVVVSAQETTAPAGPAPDASTPALTQDVASSAASDAGLSEESEDTGAKAPDEDDASDASAKTFRCGKCGFTSDEAGDCPACNQPLVEERPTRPAGQGAQGGNPTINVDGTVEISSPDGAIMSTDFNVGH